MPDVLTPQQRHRCMSHIRSKGTKPEMAVRKWLWTHGYRYRLRILWYREILWLMDKKK